MTALRTTILEAAYDAKLKKLLAQYPDLREQILWGKTRLVRQDRVIWYLKYLERNPTANFAQLQDELVHYLDQPIPEIQTFVFPAGASREELMNELSRLETQWQSRQKQEEPPKVEPGDRVLHKFPNGNYWIRLDRAYCPEEGRSGRHCGNVVGQYKTDQRLLSLRNPRGHVILTFVLEPDGTLGEMKAKGNQKPDEKYHPEIQWLLNSDSVRGISGQGFLPDMNFSVFDLGDQELEQLHQSRPQMIRDQIGITPVEVLQHPEFIRQHDEYFQAAVKQMPELAGLLNDQSKESWDRATASTPLLWLYRPVLGDYDEHVENLLDYLWRHRQASNLLKVRKEFRRDYNFLTRLLQDGLAAKRYLQAIPATTPRYLDLVKTGIRANASVITLTELQSTIMEHPELVQLAFDEQRKHGEGIDDLVSNIRSDFFTKYPDITLDLIKDSPETYGELSNETLLAIPEATRIAAQEVPEIVAINMPAELIRTMPDLALELARHNLDILKEIHSDYLDHHLDQVRELLTDWTHRVYKLLPVEFRIRHPEITALAVKLDYYSLAWTGTDWQDQHPELVNQAIRNSQGRAFQLLIKDRGGMAIGRHPEWISTALEYLPSVITWISPSVVEKNPDLVKDALLSTGEIRPGYVRDFEQAIMPVLKRRPDLALLAVKRYPSMYISMTHDTGNQPWGNNPMLIKYPVISQTAVKQDARLVHWVPVEVLKKYPQMLTGAIKQVGVWNTLMPSVWREFPDVLENLAQSDPSNFMQGLRANPTLVDEIPAIPRLAMKALTADPSVASALPRKLQELPEFQQWLAANPESGSVTEDRGSQPRSGIRRGILGAGTLAALAGLGYGAGRLLSRGGESDTKPAIKPPPALKPEPPPEPVKPAPPAPQKFSAGQRRNMLYDYAQAQGLRGLELAAFMAQCEVESYDFQSMVVHDYLSPEIQAERERHARSRPPQKNVGNETSDDNWTYRARGFIQLYGRYNYRKIGELIGQPLEQRPDLAAREDIALPAALAYWRWRVVPHMRDVYRLQHNTRNAPRDSGQLDWSNTYEVTRAVHSRPHEAKLPEREQKFRAWRAIIAAPSRVAQSPAPRPTAVRESRSSRRKKTRRHTRTSRVWGPVWGFSGDGSVEGGEA